MRIFETSTSGRDRLGRGASWAPAGRDVGCFDKPMAPTMVSQLQVVSISVQAGQAFVFFFSEGEVRSDPETLWLVWDMFEKDT